MTSWREIWVVFPRTVQVVPGQSQAWKLPSSPMVHVGALLAELGVQTGWDCFFPCEAEQLHRNVAFGLGPTGLSFHHGCLPACQKGAKRNECHMQSVSTALIIWAGNLIFQRHLYLGRDPIIKNHVLFMFMNDLKALLAILGKIVNQWDKSPRNRTAIYTLYYSLIRSFIQWTVLNIYSVSDTVLIY